MNVQISKYYYIYNTIQKMLSVKKETKQIKKQKQTNKQTNKGTKILFEFVRPKGNLLSQFFSIFYVQKFQKIKYG